MQERPRWSGLLLLAMTTLLVVPVYAFAPSGAIFTTLPDGSAVNFNIYPSKDDVYLDGGPGDGAPQHAAGLDDGTYVFQITDPSGKVLLSQDNAGCRQFVVTGGIITSVVVTGCQHPTNPDTDHGIAGALVVKMMPYADTPNPGGVYKAWAVRVEDFLKGCAELGVPNGLAVIDCGYNAGNHHGFLGSDSKTDNFKVESEQSAEIDVQFFNANGDQVDGRSITWTDTLGASNKKWSKLVYWDKTHVAHVEAVEDGYHKITIPNQIGCTVGRIKQEGKWLRDSGPQSITVRVNNGTKNNNLYYYTVFFEVHCLE